MPGFEDLKGKKFGTLTVLSRSKRQYVGRSDKRTQWLVRCECGHEMDVVARYLKRGKPRCGGCTPKKLIPEAKNSSFARVQ